MFTLRRNSQQRYSIETRHYSEHISSTRVNNHSYCVMVTVQCFEAWRQRTARRSEARQRKSEQVQEAATHLARGDDQLYYRALHGLTVCVLYVCCGCLVAKQVRILAVWREFTSSSMVRRIATERADIHFNCCMRHKCFSAWCNYHSVRLRKRVSDRTVCVMSQGSYLTPSSFVCSSLCIPTATHETV